MTVSRSNDLAALSGVVGGFAPLDSGLLIPASYLPGKPVYDVLTADEASKTNDTLTNTGLSFAVLSGISYRFRFTCLYRGAATSDGVKLALTTPTFTRYSAIGVAPNATGPTGTSSGSFVGGITSSGDYFLIPAIPTANTDYVATLEGIIVPSADGTLMLQYAAESTGQTVTLRQGSCAELVVMA